MADLYVVHSLNLMNDLVQQGFRCRRVQDDENDPRFKVFMFDNSEGVRHAVNKYMRERRLIKTDGSKELFDGVN